MDPEIIARLQALLAQPRTPPGPGERVAPTAHLGITYSPDGTTAPINDGGIGGPQVPVNPGLFAFPDQTRLGTPRTERPSTVGDRVLEGLWGAVTGANAAAAEQDFLAQQGRDPSQPSIGPAPRFQLPIAAQRAIQESPFLRTLDFLARLGPGDVEPTAMFGAGGRLASAFLGLPDDVVRRLPKASAGSTILQDEEDVFAFYRAAAQSLQNEGRALDGGADLARMREMMAEQGWTGFQRGPHTVELRSLESEPRPGGRRAGDPADRRAADSEPRPGGLREGDPEIEAIAQEARGAVAASQNPRALELADRAYNAGGLDPVQMLRREEVLAELAPKRVPGEVPTGMSGKWYSPTLEAVEGAPQDVATAEQWLGMMRKGGGLGKAEEIGLEDWLKSRSSPVEVVESGDLPRRHVTREEAAKDPYLYHVTSAPNARRIAKEGFRDAPPTAGRGGVYEANSAGYSFFTDRAGVREWQRRIKAHLFDQFDDPPDVAVVRVRRGALPESLAEDPIQDVSGSVSYRAPTGDLGGLGGGRITRQEIADFVEAARPKLTETVLSDNRDVAIGSPRGTKYETYTQPGGENYREVLIQLEPDAGGGSFNSQHWDEPNVLAHLRMTDRTLPNGEKALFLEEIQSDWHQAGRERGYRGATGDRRIEQAREEVRRLRAERLRLVDEMREMGGGGFGGPRWQEAMDEYARLGEAVAAAEARVPPQDVAGMAVPDAPFKRTEDWVALSFRRALQEAVDGGYDRIAWVSGEQAADLYDLRKQVERIEYRRSDNTLVAWGPDGGEELLRQTVAPEDLPGFIGKEPASRLLGQPQGVAAIDGDDLQVGGGGMQTFYNRIVPNVVKKEAKRLGLEIEPVHVPGVNAGGHSSGLPANVTGDMLPAGWRIETERDGGNVWYSLMGQGDHFLGYGRTPAEAIHKVARVDENFRNAILAEIEDPTNLSVRITPAARNKIKREGTRLGAAPLEGAAAAAGAAAGGLAVPLIFRALAGRRQEREEQAPAGGSDAGPSVVDLSWLRGGPR